MTRVMAEQPDYPLVMLPLQHMDVQVHPVDALDIQLHFRAQHIGHRMRYSNLRLRSSLALTGHPLPRRSIL